MIQPKSVCNLHTLFCLPYQARRKDNAQIRFTSCLKFAILFLKTFSIVHAEIGHFCPHLFRIRHLKQINKNVLFRRMKNERGFTMAQQTLSEVQLRNALAMVAGTDPNGCFFTATEVKTSDVAIGAAFGAIGAAIVAAENSGKPQAHLINYTPYGIYFLPIYFQKKTGCVIAPEQNFFIPHQEIQSVAVVRSGWKFYEIQIKTANGRKFRFNTVRKMKTEEYHGDNVERFREIYAADSKKAQRKNTVVAAVSAAVLLLLLVFVIVMATSGEDTDTPQTNTPQAQTYMASGERIPMEFCRIDKTFDMLLPATFTDLTDAEFTELFPDSAGLACANTDRTVFAVVRAWNADGAQIDADALKAEYAKTGKVLSAKTETRNGLQFAEVKSVEQDGTYIHTAEFEADGTIYSVSFIADADMRTAWENASDMILHSIVL